MSRAVYRSRRAEVMALRAELIEAGATVPRIAAAVLGGVAGRAEGPPNR